MMNSQTPLKRKTTQSLVASFLILSMLAGVMSSCDLITKTPSPTGELNYELTPIVINPATQELTLVSPTEVATEMPTLTLTPEPTATATPEATKDVYEIDMTKLHTMPTSYEYLVAHPEEFVQAPDGVADPQALLDWWNNKCISALGDQSKLEPNLKFSGVGPLEGRLEFNFALQVGNVLIKNPDFFYFKHGSDYYPVPIITLVDEGSYNNGTYAFILFNDVNNSQPGVKSIEDIMADKIIWYMVMNQKPIDSFPSDVNNAIQLGINTSRGSSPNFVQYTIGFGSIFTK